jgi:hypothetical protein
MKWAPVVAILGACGGKAPATTAARTVATSEVAPTPAAARACIKTPEADAKITRASATAGRLQFCVGEDAGQCFDFDVASATLSRMPNAPAMPVPDGARVETTNPRLEVCTGSECTSLTPKVLVGVAPLHATTNPGGTIAVVLLGDAGAGKGYAEVWDVAKTKRLSSFKYARGPFKCGEVAIAGESILVSASTCGSPSARGALYSLKGKKIANVGGREFGTFGNAFTQIEGTTWGFLEENGTRVAIQDVAKGKVIRTIDVTPLWSPDGAKSKEALGNPGESALVSLGNGKLAVIAGAPSTGKVAVIDVASGEVTVLKAPVCATTTTST